MVSENVLLKAADLLERRFGVDTLWLFGSESRNTARADSDLDLAALFRRRPAPLERLDTAAELAELLGREVDLVDLDGASPVLGLQVLRSGRLLVDRDPVRRHAFFGRTLNLYEDLKILRREAERALFERLSGGDLDVVTAKIAAIDRCLSRIAEVRERRSGLLPVDVEDITALNLQRIVQAAIDLATHVVATENYGVPSSAAEVFILLGERGILDRELAGRLRRRVGFRNIAIHEYQALDPEILAAIVERHLGDLRALGRRIVEAFGLSGSSPGA